MHAIPVVSSSHPRTACKPLNIELTALVSSLPRTPAGFCGTLTAASRSLSRSTIQKLLTSKPSFGDCRTQIPPFVESTPLSNLWVLLMQPGTDNESLWKVTLGKCSFYVATPFTRSHHYPVGRGTRCFVAVDCKTQKNVCSRIPGDGMDITWKAKSTSSHNANVSMGSMRSGHCT